MPEAGEKKRDQEKEIRFRGLNFLEINQAMDIRRHVGDIVTDIEFIELISGGHIFLTQMILGKKLAEKYYGNFFSNKDFPDIGYYEGTVVTIKPFDFERAEKIVLARDFGEEIRGVAIQYFIKTKFTNPQGLFIPN